jgi:hypothetical protein
MNHRAIWGVLLIAALAAGCASVETTAVKEPYRGPLLVAAEDSIPGVPPEVNYSEYWVRALPDPDAVLLTPDQIETSGRENPLLGTVMFDIPSMPAKSTGEQIRQYLSASARYLVSSPFFVTGAIPLEMAERRRIAALMDTSGVPDIIDIRFGMVLEHVMGRVWPTPIPVMSTIDDNEFDQAIASTLNIGDPVALLHTSKDGLWSYVQSESFSCWLPSSSVAFGDIDTIRELRDRYTPLVVIGERASLFGDPGDRAALCYLPTGTCFPVRSVGNAFCEVLIPGRGMKNELVVKRGYVRRDSSISLGFLPFTLRNVYERCFALYGGRYGWGGEYETRDCSSFVMEVFRCFNIRLPRNSASQAKAGTRMFQVADMDRAARLELLRTQPGGVTLLYMPGHIMIYLGESGGKPYAIHDFWAWREGVEGVDVAHRAARIAVTDLFLGEGSSRKAFIDRLATVVMIGAK